MLINEKGQQVHVPTGKDLSDNAKRMLREITPTKTTSNRNYKMTPAKLQYYQDRFQHELNRNSFLKALCPNHLTETQQTIIQSFVKERIQNETSLRA